MNEDGWAKQRLVRIPSSTAMTYQVSIVFAVAHGFVIVDGILATVRRRAIDPHAVAVERCRG